MGYYASGFGRIKCKCDDEKALKIEEILSEEFSVNDMYSTDGCFEFDLYMEGKYHSDCVTSVLSSVAPYVVEGSISFSGDEDEIWKFTFNKETKEFDEENADIIYWSSFNSEEEVLEYYRKQKEYLKN